MLSLSRLSARFPASVCAVPPVAAASAPRCVWLHASNINVGAWTRNGFASEPSEHAAMKPRRTLRNMPRTVPLPDAGDADIGVGGPTGRGPVGRQWPARPGINDNNDNRNNNHLRRSSVGRAYRKQKAAESRYKQFIKLPAIKGKSVTTRAITQIPVPELAVDIRPIANKEVGGTDRMDSVGGQVYHSGNFPEYWNTLLNPSEVDTTSFPPFISSSRDVQLLDVAQRNKANIVCSTSSITSILTQIYLALGKARSVNLDTFSTIFSTFPDSLTHHTRLPTTVVLRRRQNGVWGVDSAPSLFDTGNSILSALGKTMEKMVTVEPDEFRALCATSDNIKPEHVALLEELNMQVEAARKDGIHREPAAFYLFDNVVVRSQLDAMTGKFSSRPGDNVTFDLKSRAINAIRMDVSNYNLYSQERIKYMRGAFQSFEREWYDMIRSAFPKFYFQCKLGRMSGIFVTFHNTSNVFGYEFISTNEMAHFVFGSAKFGNDVFDTAVSTAVNILSDVVSKANPDSDCLRVLIGFNRDTNKLDVFVEDVPEQPLHVELPSARDRKNFDPMNSLLQVDRLSTGEILNVLEDLGVPGYMGVRSEVVSKLEETIIERFHAGVATRDLLVPSEAYFMDLVREGRLSKLEMTLNGLVNGTTELRSRTKLDENFNLRIQRSMRDVTSPAAAEEIGEKYRNHIMNKVVDPHRGTPFKSSRMDECASKGQETMAQDPNAHPTPLGYFDPSV